jgi:transmembrane sensor
MTELKIDVRVRGNDLESDPVHEAAAEWVVRLQDTQVSLEDTLAWQSWMKEDARHAEAFARIEEVSRFVREVRLPRERSRDALQADSYDGSVALGEWTASRGIRRKRLTLHRYALAVAASAALISVAVFVWRGIGIAGGSTTIVSTVVGENRTVSLDDGSRVVLGGNTMLEVAMSKDTRAIELARGEAFFVVARDPARPFRVSAGKATVVAVGTEFNVRRARDRAVVSVVEGRVIVEQVSHLVPEFVLRELKPKIRPVRVDAGQQTVAGSAGIELASAIDDAGTVTSWQSGRLAFRLQPLRYVIEDVNRYASRPISIDDESIGALVITGTVSSDNVAGWLNSLERGFGLVAVETPEGILLKRR